MTAIAELKNLDSDALIKIVDGKEDLGREVMQAMVDQLSHESELLAQLVADEDWAQLNYLTNKLCSAAAWCGMAKIKHFSHELNATVNHHNLAKIPRQLDLLRDAIDDALAEAANLDFHPNVA